MNFGAVLNPEVLFTIGSLLFNVFALPTVLNSDSAVPRLQSVPSVGVFLLFFIVPYVSIGYYLPAVSSGIGAVLWAFIAIYRAPNTASSSTDSSMSSSQAQPAD